MRKGLTVYVKLAAAFQEMKLQFPAFQALGTHVPSTAACPAAPACRCWEPWPPS